MSYNDDIIAALANHRLVFFGGAGIVRDAGLPDWRGLVQGLRDRLLEEKKLLPEFVVPIDTLIQKLNLTSALDLILSDIRRSEIVRILRVLLTPKSDSEVCKIIAQIRPPGVVTTNYDHVLESCLSPDLYHLNNSYEKLALVSTAVGGNRPFLLKLHGDIDDELEPSDPYVSQGAGFMVLSKSDYAVVMQGQRRDNLTLALHSVLLMHSILFVGYSFSDPDIDWVLRFLFDRCRFSNPSWYVGVKGESLPTLTNNLTGITPLSSWDNLGEWLSELNESARKLATALRKAPSKPPETPQWSNEERRSYLAISQYLMDIESTGLTERILAGALLDKIRDKVEFDVQWLAIEIANFTEVGLGLARALANATLSYLAELKLVETLPDGHFKTVADTISTLVKRATSVWQADKNRFYESITKRLGAVPGPKMNRFSNQLDDILQRLCVDFGQGMAEWVHRGIGRELGLKNIQDIVNTQLSDREEARQARTTLEMVFAQPHDAEISYLYRLLGAAFLSNSVRLDPFASKVIKTTFTSYELFLDSNILLPLVIREHDDHSMMEEIIEESRKVGVHLYVLECFFDEICAHLGVAKRIVEDCGGDLQALSEIVTIWGKHANCFIQGYLNTLEESEIDAGYKVNGASVKWEEYWHKYNPGELRRTMNNLGIDVVPKSPDKQFTSTPEYQEVLKLIIEEWRRRRSHLYPRPTILNQNEAIQFCFLYRRRRECKLSGLSSEIWFLSFETLLAAVSARNVSKWQVPPTFPFSAWAAFLDSRLPHAPRNPTAIVNAILKGNPEAFDLPDPVALVRKKAFGDRVPTKVEEDALQFQLSSYALIRRVESARAAVISRGRNKDRTEESRGVRKAVVGEIAREMSETISRLQEKVAKQREQLRIQEESQQQMDPNENSPQPLIRKAERVFKPKTRNPSRRKKRHS